MQFISLLYTIIYVNLSTLIMNDIDVNIDIDEWNNNIKDIKYKIYESDSKEAKAIKIYRHELYFGEAKWSSCYSSSVQASLRNRAEERY